MTRGGRNHSLLYSKKSSFRDYPDVRWPYTTSHTIRSMFGNGSCLHLFMSSCLNRPQTTTYGMLHHRCIRPACVEIIAKSWSIKESDFARLVSFPSSSRRERISSSGPLGKEMVDCRWRWDMLCVRIISLCVSSVSPL